MDITLEQNVFLVKDNIYEISEGFTDFLKQIKKFLKDIKYDVGKGYKKSARYRTIKSKMGVKDDVFGRGLNSNSNPNNLVERLELLMLDTKLVLTDYMMKCKIYLSNYYL